jgi:TorA maturation chaperone TorD
MKTIYERSLARSNTYNFLSQLYLSGPVVELYPYIKAVPDLARGLGMATGGQGSVPALDQDELAADHYQIFGLNILPYESSFLDPQNVLEGPVTEAVLADYWRAGFSPDTTSVSADHIGLELKFLADLCKTEAEAEGDQRVDVASQMSAFQATFMEKHLLRWLPGLVQAVRQENAPFYTELVELTLNLVIDHYLDLSGRIIQQNSRTSREFLLPEPPDILADENTGLRDIAHYLLTPAYSGVYISREVIEGMAKNQKLPRGFGDRSTMLTNLLRNAANYELLPSLIGDFRNVFDRWTKFYHQLPQRCQDADLFAPFTRPWQERISLSQKILALMYSAISENQNG